MKPSQVRDKSDGELVELETQLRDQLLKIAVLRATQRHRNSAQVRGIKRDLARVKTIQVERARKESNP
jgi:large subunit ribosomal protein L29